MENNTSTNGSTGSEYVNSKYEDTLLVFMRVLSFIEIPVMILTLIALGFLVKSRPAASVFISHLILSDLIQVICMLLLTNSEFDHIYVPYYYCLIVGMYFMACVALERYLLVCHPIWYKSHHSLKLSCFISVIVWFVLLTCLAGDPVYVCILCLIPYAVIILCFVGTCRGLSRSISLTALKRKLISGRLFLVLLTYTFLILPFVIMFIIIVLNDSNILKNTFFVKCLYFTQLLLFVNPLADCVLYLFMRPDVGGMMKSVQNCCQNSSVNTQNSCSTAVYSVSAQRPASHSLNTCSSV